MGLPLHLWTGEILKKVGDNCGGFVALDEDTTSKTDLHWTTIVVKMNSNVKPASVNLLAGARSYELQIWWEIRPTVAEVFPQSNSIFGGPADPGEEDDRDARANGRVKTARAVKCHTSRDVQSEVGIWSFLGNCGVESRLSSGHTRGASSKAGAKKCFEFQNVLGIRGRKGKPKNSLLRDTFKERIGPHLEGVAAQGIGQTQGVFVGPCSASLGEQSARPTGRYSHTTLRAEFKGRIEKKNGMANPCCAGPQEREVSAFEEKGSQETTSIQDQGCSEGNNIKQALSREERGALKDIEGSKVEDEGRSYCAPEKESSSGKFLEKTPSVADLEYACVKGGFHSVAVDSSSTDLGDHIQAGGKSNCLPRISELKPVGLRFKDEGEDDTRAGRSVRLDGDGLGNTDGTRADSLGRERHYRLESQEEKLPGSGQILGAIRGSGLDLDPCMELGWPHVSPPGLGLDYRAALCPDSINWALLNGLILYEPTCFKAQEAVLETGLKQGLLSRPVETSDSLGPISSSPDAGQEGIALHHGEEDELREVAIQEEGHNLKNRYDAISMLSLPLFPSPFLAAPCFKGVFQARGIHYRRRFWYHLGWWRLMEGNGA